MAYDMTKPSWPGEATKLYFAPMSRPSTRFSAHCDKDVDARHKAGHDDLCRCGREKFDNNEEGKHPWHTRPSSMRSPSRFSRLP